jgi:acylphosphatase
MMTLRVMISGRVQGVGYRDWMVRTATRLGVSGWVRNRGEALVEAVVQGEAACVDDLLAACWRGPPHARVEGVETEQVAAIAAAGFTRVASV